MSARNDFVGDVHPHAYEAANPAAFHKLKILHVLFSSRVAGSERYCVDLANGQAALGHEVHVAGRYGSPMAKLLSREVIFHGFAMPFLRGLRLRRLAARTGIEVAHGHLSHGCKALAVAPDNVARIATLHVGYKAKQHASLDGVICVNATQATRLGKYDGQSTLISNWLPDVKSAESFDLRAQLNLPRETRLIGSVGRLHLSKGYDVLVSAFRQAAPSNAALVIAGEGPHRAELEKLAKGDSRIHLPGHCNNVPGFLRNLDLFVSPSREESAGLAILEAMSEGLPIIATATEGPLEYLSRHPVTLVEPGSVERLSAALIDVLREESVVRLSRVSYDLAPFSRSTGISNVLDFYSRVLAGAGGQAASDTDQPRLIYATKAQE
ncbi:glycosyltransferase involved in cell wall biosynthesis [Rhizobium sp. BK650]|uniref:glycosyltransferase family 4 protein n=1 Tax=Rhizobium sp. BK650 TaxID=2586990 RepID=UPI00160774E3|nr:glycosyltransferase family 4 protein [Rhizobium sp. BK650]MBB3655628.1 glycosyltransferase involved in cell wall biosynthesis [Rhizobium sp. BK650]